MSAALLDASRPVRAGEELDEAALGRWLAEQGLAPAGAGLRVTQFPSGHSNLTYLVAVGDRELVLRRPPRGANVKSAHDMAREHRVLERLAPLYPLAPRPVALCEDPGVLGAPFYVMERIRGVILRGARLGGETVSPDLAARLGRAFIDNLAQLHALEVEPGGLLDLGRPEGYCRRQVEGWARRWKASRLEPVPQMEELSAWLSGHLPESPPATLLHNDYKIDNLVLDPADPARLVGVLDWEMATVGDPWMDVGTALGYWREAGDPLDLQQFSFGPTAVPGSPTRQQLLARYCERTGRESGAIAFYYCFALFKTAVVAQQIYARYRQGLTQDERFARLGESVRLLARTASAALQTGSLEPC